MTSPELSRRGFGLFAASLLLRPARGAWAGAGETNTDTPPGIAVQPLLPAPRDEEIAFVVRAIAGFYNAAVSVIDAVPMPKAAFYAPRQRYRADALLEFLDRRRPERSLRILGVTAADISTTKEQVYDWGILGLAHMPGTSCVISSFRCKRRATGAAHATVRLGKTAVHELGHTFGLEHCSGAGCLLEDAGGSVLTTDAEYDLCDDCRAQLAASKIVRESRHIPWPKPA